MLALKAALEAVGDDTNLSVSIEMIVRRADGALVIWLVTVVFDGGLVGDEGDMVARLAALIGWRARC